MPKIYDLENLPTTQPEMDEMLAEVIAEIDQINVDLKEIDPEGDEDWIRRAVGARYIRFKIKAKLEQRIKKMQRSEIATAASQVRLAEREMALEAQRLNTEAARIKAERTAANVRGACDENRAKLVAVLRFLRETQPETMPAVYSILDEIEHDFAGHPHRQNG